MELQDITNKIMIEVKELNKRNSELNTQKTELEKQLKQFSDILKKM